MFHKKGAVFLPPFALVPQNFLEKLLVFPIHLNRLGPGLPHPEEKEEEAHPNAHIPGANNVPQPRLHTVNHLQYAPPVRLVRHHERQRREKQRQQPGRGENPGENVLPDRGRQRESRESEQRLPKRT